MKLITVALLSLAAFAQPQNLSRAAIQLDLDGKYTEARALFQQVIDSAADPRAKANAQRAMAMSWAFESNCKKTGEYEQMVMDYWVTRETEEPRNAFYQEGEMANEAARVCIEAADLDSAERWYKLGTKLGLKEPEIPADRAALWEYRLAHAQARLAARRGKRAEAEKYVAASRAALEKMTALRAAQAAFLPYLTGYVALYLGDAKTAAEDFQKANLNDPFIQCLLAAAYEKLGEKDKAIECYRKAYATTAHNPPAAYAKPLARKKLGV